jgi:hypothetical protein
VTRPHEAQLTFEVEKSPKAVAECTLSALSLRNEVVGRLAAFVIGPNDDNQRVTTHTVTFPTSELANVVEVEDCQITRKG